MTLKDDALNLLNDFFKRSKIPCKFNNMLIYRPAGPPCEHIEVINDAKIIPFCDKLYVLFDMDYIDHWYEYEIRYEKVKDDFQTSSCQLKYCSVVPGETPEEVMKKMIETMKFMSLIILTALKASA